MTATYLPNPLNSYSTYSYNISIHQINPTVVSETGGILIADNSKSSKFNIEFCEQTLVLGHDAVRSSFANRFDFKITEPNGATFFDEIRSAAILNGIPNITTAAYIIRISFLARDKDNRPIKYQPEFKYTVTFTDVVAQIDHGGSHYNITAIELSTGAYSYIQGVSKSTITFVADTVGEAIQNLKIQINEAQRAMYLLDSNSVYYDDYDFELDTETGADGWANWKIETLDNESDSRFYKNIGGKHQFMLPDGTNLHEYIGAILRMTAEWKKLPTADGSYSLPVGGEPSDAGSETKLKVFYKLVSEVKYGEYDVLRNDYKKTIKYKIKRYIIGDISSDSAENARILVNPELQRTKIREYAARGLLRKKYEYLFTGKNTEVINLDLKFEMSYFLISPVSGGQIDQDRLGNNNARNENSIREKVKSLKKSIIDNERATEALIATGDIGISEIFRRDNTALTSSLISTVSSVPGGIPIRYHQAKVANHNGYSSENDTVGSSRLHHAAIIANLENGVDLIKIEIHVRGDPYWMGKPNKFAPDESGVSLANYDIGGNLFFLKVNLPTQENSDGRRLPKRENVITGLYRVTSVINQFRGGQFTQYLHAVREKTIDAENIPETLNVPEIPINPGRGNIIESPTERTESQAENTNPPSNPPNSNNDIPSNANVGESATESVMGLDQDFVLGFYGTDENPYATIRLADGRYQTNVVVGTNILGSTVVDVSKETNSVTLENGTVLSMPE